ncbi:MAG: ABC transporter ATP-binding protein [Chloroflexi bacterium]|nr:ABC transporter ATP-binding protein [Chloroflexota bacterium]
MAAVLEVSDVRTHFYTREGIVKAVDGVSYEVGEGETVALVGESGCGKSVSALSILRLIPNPPGRIVGGQVRFGGRDLFQIDETEMRKVRGKDIAMIFQEPMTSLNPVLSIERQLTEGMRLHLGLTENAARERAIELMNTVGIPDAPRRLKQYPHHFSGGMRQRVMIAMAISCSPKLIIADEPTTALDVTIQAQILDLMKQICRDRSVALVIITHNLGVVARYADRINIMYAGRIIERGTSREIFNNPRHPYSLGLLRSVPRLDRARKDLLETIEGQPPNLSTLPGGCYFQPRCRFAVERCSREYPPHVGIDGTHASACWVAKDLVREVAVR